MITPTPPPHRRAARIYSRPRFGFKPARRLLIPALASAASLAVTAWWVYRHLHR